MIHILILIITMILSGCAVQQVPPYNPETYMRAQSLIDQGTLYLRQEQLPKAKATFEVALSVMELAAAYDGLGVVAFLQHDYEHSADYYWKAYRTDPEYTHVLGNLALLYEITGNDDRARMLYEEAISKNPDYAPFRNNYAAFLEANRAESHQAREEMQRASILAEHPIIHNNMKFLNAEDKNHLHSP
ncbi:MAG: tetratricopeptide repeat protein [Bdellovibrionales bacterium]|nr:tetratricopeptide repeat protein [Bdellovibrionales bacterium]